MKIKAELELKELETINDSLRSAEVELHSVLSRGIDDKFQQNILSALININTLLDITNVD